MGGREKGCGRFCRGRGGCEAVVQEREDSLGERGDGLAWGGEEEERWG